MQAPKPHKWAFRPRFRRNAFGWKSQPAIKRIREAVSEIKQVARGDKQLGAEGAVIFLEKLSPAIAQVDSSSGAIGTAVGKAIVELVRVIAATPVDADTRTAWIERLWLAYEDDDIPYLELLGDHWGELCASKDIASSWADEYIHIVRVAWSHDSESGGFFMGTTNCLSALIVAERYDEVLGLLALKPSALWRDRKYGVAALVGLGRKVEAIEYAERSDASYDNPAAIAETCEQILLSSGMAQDAYARYGLAAS